MPQLAWILSFTALGGILSALAASLFLAASETVRARVLPHLVSFATGALLSAALLGLLPHAIEGAGTQNTHAIGLALLAGLLIFFVLEKLVLWRHCHQDTCEGHLPHVHRPGQPPEEVHGEVHGDAHGDVRGELHAAAASRTAAQDGTRATEHASGGAWRAAGPGAWHDAAAQDAGDYAHGYARRYSGGQAARRIVEAAAPPPAVLLDDDAGLSPASEAVPAHGSAAAAQARIDDRAAASASLILIGDGFHNVLDGVLIAAAFMTDVHLGVVTALAVFAHEIPQEIGDLAILLHGGMSRMRALTLNLLTSLTSVLGGLIAYFALDAFTQVLPYAIAIAASSFLYIAVADLIPGLHRRVDPGSGLRQLVFIVLGAVVIYVGHSLAH